MVSLAIVALLSALIAQEKRAAERERLLKIEILQAKRKSRVDDGMAAFLGELGIVILKDATQAELLLVGKQQTARGYSRTPTAKVLGKEFADGIARRLLDRRNYIYLSEPDMPDPQFGFRLSRGEDSIDLLFSLEGSRSGATHQHIWVYINSKYDKSYKMGSSEKCFYDADLEKLLTEANGK